MTKKLGMFSILLGAALILSALFLYGYNRYEDYKSGSEANSIMEEVRNRIEGETVQEEPLDGIYDPEMPVVEIDGYEYVGYVSIPDIGIQLPIMADWDYDKMKIAACRQLGSTRTDDLVIAAHNYDSFFGRLKDLQKGAKVIVTDMEGINNSYQVDKIETVKPEEVDRVLDSGYDLVLYTCTYDGASRVTAFCSRVNSQ